ncbi:CidA/LrgA family protein [Actibacterium sp. XHP0104]|uniref:CidA/LrgA family protein n=1 Tax=Actibacterium sp. XHP0104 TaxID=2984335 RepID=UPI0021E70572|nr:CidA/LrgA family protein [Actibacterium sp. XHP0104]MCV2881633.1 CidA/LrgA family protein [Actibacterium sp. XHP0104]
MIHGLAILLIFQLIGEVIARTTGMPVPGPVIGMAGLLICMILVPRLTPAVQPTAQGVLSHLSLLFVPAGVGVIGHMGLMVEAGPRLLLTLVLSTVIAIAVAALVFSGMLRLTGAQDG